MRAALPSLVTPDVIRGKASFLSPHPNRGLSVPTARSEAPAWSRMFRGFAFRLSDQGRDFALCLAVIPGTIITATALAMVLAPIWQGIPA